MRHPSRAAGRAVARCSISSTATAARRRREDGAARWRSSLTAIPASDAGWDDHSRRASASSPTRRCASAARRARSRARSGTTCPRTASTSSARRTTTPAGSARARGATSRSSSSARRRRVAPRGVDEPASATARSAGSCRPTCASTARRPRASTCARPESLFRTEFGTVVVQEDICNGCGYCVPACPFGVIDKREADGRVWKCTMCYDRLHGGHGARVRAGVPHEVDPVRAARRAARARRGAGRASCTATGSPRRASTAPIRRRRRRVRRVLPVARRARGVRPAARSRRDHARSPAMWRAAAAAAGAMVAARRGSVRRFEAPMSPRVAKSAVVPQGRRAHVLRPAGAEGAGVEVADPRLLLHRWSRRRFVDARRGRATCKATPDRRAVPTSWRWPRSPRARDCSIDDLGRPSRFANMLRVFRPSSPMNMGSWLLAVYGPLVGAAAAVRSARRGHAGRPGGRARRRPCSRPRSPPTPRCSWRTPRCPCGTTPGRELPFVFMGSACASAGAAAVLCSPRTDLPAARRLAVLGVAVEMAWRSRWSNGSGRSPRHTAKGGAARWRRPHGRWPRRAVRLLTSRRGPRARRRRRRARVGVGRDRAVRGVRGGPSFGARPARHAWRRSARGSMKRRPFAVWANGAFVRGHRRGMSGVKCPSTRSSSATTTPVLRRPRCVGPPSRPC